MRNNCWVGDIDIRPWILKCHYRSLDAIFKILFFTVKTIWFYFWNSIGLFFQFKSIFVTIAIYIRKWEKSLTFRESLIFFFNFRTPKCPMEIFYRTITIIHSIQLENDDTFLSIVKRYHFAKNGLHVFGKHPISNENIGLFFLKALREQTANNKL